MASAPNPPVFDPRDFQDLVDEAKRRIPQYCPEWTDHNVSDPGVTLIELFAWMVDIFLYRLNKVPDRDYLKFLELVGARPNAAVPAVAELLFWLSAPQPETKFIRRGTNVGTRQTETKAAIQFTTDAELRIRPPVLESWVLATEQSAPGSTNARYVDVSERLRWHTAAVPVFQTSPKDGDAFYLGFADDLAGQVLRLHVRCEPLQAPNINQEDPPMAWEFWNGESWGSLLPAPEDVELLHQIEPECADLGLRLDDTRGLNRDGRVLLFVPRTAAPYDLPVGEQTVRSNWLRCRATRRQPNERFFESSPVVHGLRPEAIGGYVMARHSFEIPGEPIGRSDGTPGQTFGLLYPPVLPRRADGDAPETIEVQRADGTYEPWTEVDQFADSRATDSHFMLDDLTGEVRFGPRLREPGGEERQFGRVPPRGRLIRFTRYRSGGGTIGNVGRGTLSVPRSLVDLSYVKWITNLRAATGGRDQESLDDFKLRGPKLVRTREVAVTRADYEFLAREATPQVARVRCVGTPSDPTLNGSSPTSVRLLLIPALPSTDERVPREQLELRPEVRRDLCRRVRAYLEERCPVTTELAVGIADYRWVSVRAQLVIKARADLEAVDRERRRHQVQEAAERALYRFIQPVTGWTTGDGWPFGKALTLGEVYPVLQAVPEVEYVEEIRFRPVTFDAQGRPTVGSEERLIRLDEAAVLCSDAHQIDVVEE
jgi:predicted phage baseplate assembly protein